jgi:hypothetical protein
MRTRLLLIGLTIGLAGSLKTARGFHLTTQACANSVGSASVGLTQSGGTLTFAGTVTCNGATSVSITSLTLTRVVPAGATTSGGTASCGPCFFSITATGTAPDAPGIYKVAMAFTATGPGGTYFETLGAGFLEGGVGVGQPLLLCQESPGDDLEDDSECPF